MKKTFFTLLLCLLIQGCVSTAPTAMKLIPQVLSGQKIIDQDDSEAVISHKKSSVALRPPPDGYSLDARPMIYVSLYGTEKPFDFSTEDIQIFVDGNPHRVLTYDELEAEIKSKKDKTIAQIELRYDDRSRKIADTAYKSTAEEVAMPPRAETPGDTAQYGYKYDIAGLTADQSDVEANKEAEINAVEIETEKTLATLNAVMLKKTTVEPNKWYRGYVAIEKIPDPARSHEIKIIVAVAGEEHEFLFNHSKIQP
jgi:hypothetical protein